MQDVLVEVPEPLRRTPLGHRRAPLVLKVVLVVLAALAVAGFLATGGAQPADPFLAGSRVKDFDEATLTVRAVAADAPVPAGDHCSLFATTPQQIATGMMRQRDFAGYASMVFRFREPTRATFYNRAVPIALTVAWFAADGRFLGSNDLEPCPDMEGCPTIASPGLIQFVVEVGKGRLGDLGLGEGSTISVTPGCR